MMWNTIRQLNGSPCEARKAWAAIRPRDTLNRLLPNRLFPVCKQAVEEAPKYEALEAAWTHLYPANQRPSTDSALSKNIDNFKAIELSDSVVTEPFEESLRWHLGCAGLAHALRATDPGKINLWAARLVEKPDDTNLLDLDVIGGVRPQQLLYQAFDQLEEQFPGAQLAPIWDLTRMFLGDEAAEDEKIDADLKRELPLLVFAGTGDVTYLRLTLIPERRQGIYSHPRNMAFVAMDSAFWRTAQNALDAALAHLKGIGIKPKSAAIRWNLVRADRYSGASHGMATGVGIAQLLSGRPVNRQAAISECVPPGPVGHVWAKVTDGVYGQLIQGLKVLDANHRPAVTTVIVHRENFVEAQEALNLKAGEGQIKVVSASTFGEACRAASGLVDGLDGYFKKLIKRPDDPSRRPIYLPDGVLPSQLYVKLDVLVHEVRPDRDGPPGIPGAMGSPGNDSRFDRPPSKRTERPLPDIEGIVSSDQVRRPFDQVEAEQQRLVLLGPPGGGKTSLVERIASQRASETRKSLADQDFDIEKPPLPISLRLDELARKLTAIKDARGREDNDKAVRTVIAETLIDQFQINEEVAAFMAEKAHQRTSYLLLDGLDEVKPENEPGLGPLWDVLKNTATWQCRVLITSRPYGYSTGQFPFGIVECQLAPFDDRQIDQFVNYWFASDEEGQRNRAQLNELRHQNPAVAELSQTPFLLTLLCFVQQNGAIPEDVTRTSLYEQVILHMLGLPADAQRGGGSRSLDTAHADSLEDALLDIVWHEFRERVETSRIDFRRLKRRLKKSGHLFDPLYRSGEVTNADRSMAIIAQLSKRRVLFPEGPPKGSYVFPHRSLMEYFLAKAIAQQINGDWEPTLASGEDAWTESDLLEFLDGCADSSHWDLIVQFVSGWLDDPAPLLELLADEQRDGFFRVRLGLAGQCLGEIPRKRLESLDRSLIDDITQQIWAIWWMHRLFSRTVDAFRHLGYALPSLVRAGGKAYGAKVLDICCKDLKHENWLVRKLAVMALGQIGPSAVREGVLNRLVEMLDDENWLVRKLAVEALDQLGPSAAHAYTAERLVEMLKDEDWWLSRSAAKALDQIGPSGARADVLKRLVEMLNDEDSDVRVSAVKALGKLSPAAAGEGVMDRLVEMLNDEDSDVRVSAVKALGKLGPATAREGVMDRLVEMLHDEDSDVRVSAVKALGKLGPAAAREGVLDRFVEMLKDEDSGVRIEAVNALGQFGPSAAREGVLDRLVEMLKDENWYVRIEAVDALGQLDPSAAREGALDRLVEMLKDESWIVQLHAAWALRHLSPSAATEDMLDRLVEMLNDEDSYIRQGAAQALSEIGPSAARADVLERLVEMLNDEDSGHRDFIIEALVRIDPSVALADILDRLVQILNTGHLYSRGSAVIALHEIGPSAARKDVLDGLVKAWNDENPCTRDSAVIASCEFDRRAEIMEDMNRNGQVVHFRVNVLRALVRFGPSSALDNVLEKLMEILDDRKKDNNTYSCAYEVLKELPLSVLRRVKRRNRSRVSKLISVILGKLLMLCDHGGKNS